MFLRKAILLTILISLLLKFMEIGFILIQYQLNKDYIAAMLCENKDKPVMKCFGKCQLSKKFLGAEKKEEQNRSLIEKFSFPVFAILELWDTFIILPAGLHYPYKPDIELYKVYLASPLIPPDASATLEVFYS